jgi:hypothetical protein
MSNEPLISGGYIILSRKIIESEIWDKPPLYLKVWIYLLTRAQHKEFRKLKRGQLFVSIPEIQDACSWYVGFRKERPTKDQIYQIIDWLRKPNEAVHEAGTKATMITTTKATQGLLINIDNYGFYQNPKNYESNDEDNDEKVMRATREQREPNNINKNVKNAENEKKENLSLQIENFRQRYSPGQLKTIDQYFEMLRHTRASGKISESVILKTYKDWDKYPTICVEYGVKTHADNPTYHSRKENYTIGIIRNTSAEEAAFKLNGTNGTQKPKTMKPDIRDKEIEFQQWCSAGNDPEAFDWSTGRGREH